MALNTVLLITLQQLKGFGNKTVLELSKVLTAQTIDDLCEEWHSLKGKKYTKITEDDLYNANQYAYRIIEASEAQGIGIISYYDEIFPEILKTCVDEDGKLNPPLVLYYRGDINALEKPGVAVIGTREPTPMGTKAGIFFASELAKKGYNIVSGLAVGCDTTGHEGALAVNGTTTAFLANSLAWNDIYPPENVDLAHRIVENGGLLLSEYPIGYKGGKFAFIARDRLQAGLSYATLVVQTGKRGGTLHAVNATLAANKPLYAIKYNHDTELRHHKVQGNIKLLNEGKAMPFNTQNMSENFDFLDKYVETHNKQMDAECSKGLFD